MIRYKTAAFAPPPAKYNAYTHPTQEDIWVHFFDILARFRISPSSWHSSLPSLMAKYNPSHKLLTQSRTLANFLRRLRLRCYTESFMGANTLKALALALSRVFIMNFLKLATTFNILSPFTISIKHLVFSSLVLRFFGKNIGFVFCSFFV